MGEKKNMKNLMKTMYKENREEENKKTESQKKRAKKKRVVKQTRKEEEGQM